jgi:ribonuclease BN (tRNA processing enzyme)
MKYTIIGAGSGLPQLDLHLSGVVVQTEKHNLLLDCGEGTSKQLIRKGFDKDFLDAVLITHYHPDHVTGLYIFIQMLYLQNRTKLLKLFLPERPAAFMESLHLFYTFEQRLPFELQVFEMAEAELHYSEVNVVVNDHLAGYESFLKMQKYLNQMLSYCIALSAGNKTLLYTSDINSFNNIGHLIEKAQTIILDALHPEAGLIISLAADLKKNIILNHGCSESLKEQLETHQFENVGFAVENKTFEL